MNTRDAVVWISRDSWSKGQSRAVFPRILCGNVGLIQLRWGQTGDIQVNNVILVIKNPEL